MFNRRDLPGCRHAVGSLVGSEVAVVSAASVCDPSLPVPPAKGPYAPPTSLGCQRLTGVHPVSFTGGLVQTVKQQIRGERQVKPDQRDISDFVLLVRVSPQTLQQCMTVTISRCCG